MQTTTNKATDRQIAEAPKDIPGWGIDADPQNNPTYPMKRYTGADYQRINYERAVQQPVNVEVLHSNERPAITRVFGTSTPPSGISGMLRRYAFKFSEGSAAHWMTLILADRVNVVEGLVDDLKQGHVPNIFAERGWQAEWKYNRQGAVKSLLIGAAVTTAVVALLVAQRKRRVARREGLVGMAGPTHH
jgi:hypothetical protein